MQHERFARNTPRRRIESLSHKLVFMHEHDPARPGIRVRDEVGLRLVRQDAGGFAADRIEVGAGCLRICGGVEIKKPVAGQG
jgi:hypothetical protein